MSKERFKYYYNESVKRYEVFDCYVNLPLSKKGVIKLLNDQQDKIADLEAKLAKSEERCKKAYRDGLLQKQFDKDMEIDQLKQQLEDAEEHIDNLELQLREQYQIVDDKDEQLAKKEKMLERIMSGEYIPANIAEKSLELSNQCKISFAVEQLEKARKLVDKLLDNCGDKQYKVWEVFDNQIKKLKGDDER